MAALLQIGNDEESSVFVYDRRLSNVPELKINKNGLLTYLDFKSRICSVRYSSLFFLYNHYIKNTLLTSNFYNIVFWMGFLQMLIFYRFSAYVFIFYFLLMLFIFACFIVPYFNIVDCEFI